MLEKPEAIELVVKHPLEKKKTKKKKNNPQITWQRAVTGLQLSGFGKPLSPPLLLQ